MIRIIYDPEKLKLIDETSILVSFSGFPKHYDEVLKTINDNDDYSIIVRDPTIQSWFKHMASRFPQGTFVFEIFDARKVLSKKLKVDIPEKYSNEEIRQASLLTSDLGPQPGQRFENIVLSHYYGPVFTTETFPFTQIVDILDAIQENKWNENRSSLLISRIYSERLESWKGAAHSSEQRALINELISDPISLKYRLIAYRVLTNYPTIGEKLMGDQFVLYQRLDPPLEDLKIVEETIPDAIIQVTYYLNQQSPENIEEMKSLIDSTSGLLQVEFHRMENILISHPNWIKTEIINQLESKFSSHNRTFIRKITQLRELIRPPKPAYPDLDWDFKTMLDWAVEVYMPYQAWCDKQEKFDPEIFQIGDKFSEWLVHRWEDIHANSNRMVFNILPNNALAMKRQDVINLVIVIDNFGWSFYRILKDLFQEQGIYLADIEPYIAMIPSETEISKKCLLSGEIGYQAINNKAYSDIVEKGWVPYFNDHKFQYIADIGGLGNINSIEASTYVVNYLAVDRAMHKSADEIGMSHRDHIQYLLEKLVENCMDFIEQHGIIEKVNIHIVSDHGATRIPATISNDLDPDFFKTNNIDIRSRRYAAVSHEVYNNLPDNLKFDCFFISANKYLLPQNMLCARRANRFLTTDKDIYVHGGLLPEEMIVPYCVFKPILGSLEQPTVLLEKNEFRFRKEIFTIEVGNPNDTAIEKVLVNILNNNVESEPVSIKQITAKTNRQIEIQARFNLTNITEEQTNLRFRIRFYARGEQHKCDITKEISMRKLVEEKSSGIFDD